jgi:hypothetical protein
MDTPLQFLRFAQCKFGDETRCNLQPCQMKKVRERLAVPTPLDSNRAGGYEQPRRFQRSSDSLRIHTYHVNSPPELGGGLFNSSSPLGLLMPLET